MSNTPEQISFNLDTVERGKSYEPFRINIDGRVITLTDPAEFSWQDAMEIENPALFLRYALSEKPGPDGGLSDKEYFKAQRFPAWKLGELIKAYVRHYELDTQGNGVASRI